MKRARWISRCGALAALACLATACTRESVAQDSRGEAHASAAGVAVYTPRIVEPASDVAALYFVVVDHDGLGDRLLGVQSSVGEAMLHESVDEQGVARMRRALAGFAVPAHGALRLEPGGPHVMLVGLREPLTVGQRIRVTLEFERVGPLALEVPVVAADADALALGSASAEPGSAVSSGDDLDARTR